MAIVTIKKGVLVHHYPVVDHTFKLEATISKATGIVRVSVAQLKLVASALDKAEMSRLYEDYMFLPFNKSECVIVGEEE